VKESGRLLFPRLRLLAHRFLFRGQDRFKRSIAFRTDEPAASRMLADKGLCQRALACGAGAFFDGLHGAKRTPAVPSRSGKKGFVATEPGQNRVLPG
jgi:hypothetical protein